MPDLTSIYNYYYMFPGDKWYAGFDEENMQIADNQFAQMAKFVGSCVGTGWTISKLSEEREDQLLLLSGYLNNPTGEFGQKLTNLNLNFSSSLICAAGTTNNITLSGGAPNSIDGVNLSSNDKILVKNQNTKSQNGIYKISSLGSGSDGTWIRDEVLDSPLDFSSNFLTYVSGGVANTSTLWIGASLGSTFGTNDLFFVNAFDQCVKVYPGDGIIDLFYGKTQKPFYFRFINSDDHYIWAEKTLNIEYNNSAKIVAPEEPNFNYGDLNKSTYLGTVVSSSGSTLYDLSTVNSIVYGPNRRQFNDSLSEIQSLLKNNFRNHRHLGNLNTSQKIDLQTHLILNAVNSFENDTKISSSVFILQNSDGTLFDQNFDNFGNPQVYVDDRLLDTNEYKFILDSTPRKIALKNSIPVNSNLLIYLPLYKQKNITCIDSEGNLIDSIISSFTSHVYLTDGEQEDPNPNDENANLVFKKFVWNKANYLDAKIYIKNNLIQSKHYIINPYNASVKFLSTLPEYNNYKYSDVKIVLDEIGREIDNKLVSEKLQDIDASSFDKGTIQKDRISNFSHSKNSKYRIKANYIFDKFLVAGLGNSYFYPENQFSDLQYNTNTNSFYQTSNLSNKNYIVLSDRGLMRSDSSFTQIKIIDTWNNDNGLPLQIIDDILIPENENKFKTTYIRSKEGKIFYTNDGFLTWHEFNIPYASNSKQVIVNNFDISTDKNEIDSGVYAYSSFIYLATNDGLYFANPLENQTQYEWDWFDIPIYINDNIINLKNIDFVKEVCQKNIEINAGSQDIITYDRKIYVASSDNDYPGLYYGDTNFVKRIFDEEVKGITWINDGLYKNNLIWWNDYDVFITHSSRLNSDVSGEFWEFPFDLETTSYSNCNCATIENIDLQGLQTIDGYVLQPGDRVLVKNQNDATENGIYSASSTVWSRSSDLNIDSEFVYGKKVEITNGEVNSNSIWYLKYQSNYEVGFTNIEWDVYKKKIYSTTIPSFSPNRSLIKNVIVRNSNLNNIQYIVVYDNGISLVNENSKFTIEDLIYEKPYQGSINNAISIQTNEAEGSLFLSTENSIYKSTIFLWKDKDVITDIDVEKNPWNRTENSFQTLDDIFLLNSKTNTEITNFLSFSQWQLINTLDNLEIGTNIVFEKDFRNFYLDPWYYDYLDDQQNPLKYTLTVYINNKPSKIPYFTNPNTGLIQFTKSVSKKDFKNISVSIFLNDQFLSDTSSFTHDELFLPSYSNDAIARLAVSNSPNERKLYLNQTISNDEQIIRIDDGVNSEVLYIETVNNFVSPVEVVLYEPRSAINSSYVYPAGATIYSVRDSLSNNLQDATYNLISKERYNLGSLNNLNHNKLISKIDDEIANVFDIVPSAPFSQKDTRGFLNNKYTNDFVNDTIFDSSISIFTSNNGTPSLFEKENSEVNVIYDIENLNKNGENTLIATNTGIWKYNNYRWQLVEKFEKNSSYFVSQYKDTYKIGTDLGLYTVDNQFNIQKDSTFTQKINHYINWFSGNDEYELYSKSDGLIRIKNPQSENFTSEYISLLDNKEVFYSLKTIGLRNNIDEISTYDLILAASVDGIYGICNGTNNDVFGNELVSKKLFDLPNGISKINNIFTPLNIPSIPVNNNLNQKLFISTDSGLYKINNFRWCDPNQDLSQTFNVESIFLNGLDCKCFVLDQSEAESQSVPGNSKIFIGTNYGVYRSLDGGNHFEPTQRFDQELPLVFSLKIFSSSFVSNSLNVTKNVIVACTNLGLWYTIDDGDNWYKCGDETINFENPVLFKFMPSNYIEFSTNDTTSYLAQTFRAPSVVSTIDKISIDLRVNESFQKRSEYINSLENNYIQVLLCQLDGDGKPNLSSVLATSSSPNLFLKDLIKNNLNYFEFNYNTSSNQNIAIVVNEIVTSNGISLLQWKKSQNYNSNYVGFGYTRYNSLWEKLDNENNQFVHRIFYTSNLSPIETQIAVGKNLSGDSGWEFGSFKGCVANDNGELVSDIRFLISLLIDDTLSMSRIKDKFQFIDKTDNFFNTLFNRTNRLINTDIFDLTAVELWTINNQLLNLTNNIFSNNSSSISEKIKNLRLTGNYTDLINSLEIASIGLFPVSLELTFQSNYGLIADYMDSESYLKLSNLVDEYNDLSSSDDWDLTKNDIPNSKLATSLMLEDFSHTYIPILLCITDGENITDSSISTIVENSNNFWNEKGFKILFFNLSKNEFQDEFNEIAYQTDGTVFNLNDSSDLQIAYDSLLHGEANNLFNSEWNRKFEYDEEKFISRVYTSYTVSSSETINSSCVVKFRYSSDNINYSDWIILSNNVNYYLNKKVVYLEYQVLMTEGWNGNSVKPSVQTLYHVEVEPSVSYLFTDVFETDGYINEYLIDTNNVSDNYNIEFGLTREDSNNWNEYFILSQNRNSILPNRQKQYKATDEIFYDNLIINPIDSNNFEFEILKDSSVFKWSDNYQEFVYSGSELIDAGNYRIDNNTGIIIFDQIQENFENIRIDIIELSNLYISFGESTTTVNYQEYFASSGSWKKDSNVVVLINNQIVRENYILNFELGSVIFRKKLKKSDVVTIFIHHSFKYRLCAKISTYENNIPSLINFEFLYNSLKNLNKLSELSVISPPYLQDNRVILTSSLKTDDGSLSVKYPISVSYKFLSDFNTDDFESLTSWWIQKNIYFEEIPGYTNRIIQNNSDLNESNSLFEIGDEIYVKVQPKDKFKTGITYQSENYILTNITKPNIVDVQIKTNVTIINNLVISGSELRANYIFNSVNSDQTIINWYDRTDNSKIIFTGAILPKEFVTSGKIISFIATPYDGNTYGDPIESNSVLVA